MLIGFLYKIAEKLLYYDFKLIYVYLRLGKKTQKVAITMKPIYSLINVFLLNKFNIEI